MLCPNCNFTETHDAEFCSSCGQKFAPYKITIKEFLKDLVDHVFAFETTFFNTIRKIFIPGQLTIDYFKGYRRRYYHPLRLFFVLLVMHLGVLGGLIPYDKIFREITFKANQIQVKENIKKDLDTHFGTKKDPQSLRLKDSVYQWLDLSKEAIARDSLRNVRYSLFDMKIPQNELISLSTDSLARKYHFEGKYFPTVIAGQMKKFTLDPKGMIQFILGNISWMMILMLPILALCMKVLFRRGSRYYIEHLFYLYHWHAAAFLLAIIGVFFFRNTLPEVSPFFLVLIILFGFVAWLRYYKQHWAISGFKFMIMSICYLVLFMFFITFTALVSFSFY